ncbi:hypothetical protein ACFQFS_08630 [Novosphingobium lubricantis]
MTISTVHLPIRLKASPSLSPSIATIGEDMAQPWEASDDLTQHQRRTVETGGKQGSSIRYGSPLRSRYRI